MLAPRVVANPDGRGHTETCSEAWGEQQPVDPGLGSKKGWRQRLWPCGAAQASTMPGDAEIPGTARAEGHVTVQTLHRAGDQKLSHASPL